MKGCLLTLFILNPLTPNLEPSNKEVNVRRLTEQTDNCLRSPAIFLVQPAKVFLLLCSDTQCSDSEDKNVFVTGRVLTFYSDRQWKC